MRNMSESQGNGKKGNRMVKNSECNETKTNRSTMQKIISTIAETVFYMRNSLLYICSIDHN